MTTDLLFPLYRSMLRIRRTEERLAARYHEQQIRCPMHLCIGQEAVAAGVCLALLPEDQVFSNHRAHGHYLAKGGDLRRMLAELYGRATGCCGGRGGSMHLIDRQCGFMGSTPIVGGTVPLAVGAAWSASLQGTGRVVAVFFGDGCFEEGVLHESMNFAVLHALPILFVCENNGYSVYTRLDERQAERPILGIAEAHGCEVHAVDGSDVLEVHRVAKQAVDAAREGGGPQFIEAQTYRWLEHCGPNDDSELGYRPLEELASWKARCPLSRAAAALRGQDPRFQDRLDELERQVGNEIDEAFDYALGSPFPAPGDIEHHLYA
ncbi:thiamine pyrophosphate-dependent dehydrogenase E1 component subunit alpha [Thiohalobacter sp. IOR34]|uniref:thiamine pyrophosphate-dependent dehydrogenase E1 component subunit alpha n=1 Tax=Thiohalobacter sp. IOR34 TaxID=3057176 RepID=UPI0025B01C7F|nr:thiamine pyrophosphate-dependent dehydrogenase E1 component subunit alpha [Thiohalobacter sp. IOR34]WJW74600.1 thiamine pyrophosphate-dependent dehydrogenase E1 component subunit alpha [Thiohalobacter sp. IOR34]